METRATTPGWYADPNGRFEFRYHNGTQWTADVATNGHRFVDSTDQPPPVPWQPRPPRGMAIAAFATGLAAVMLGWVPFVFVLAAGSAVAAAVFGVLGINTAKRHDGYGHGLAVAGLVLAPLGLAACVGGLFFTRYVVDQFREYVEPGPHELFVAQPCTVADGRATLHGTIHNLDDHPRDYRIVVDFTSSDQQHSSTVAVYDVAADATSPWEATSAIGGTSVTCEVSGVFGPFPFDVGS